MTSKEERDAIVTLLQKSAKPFRKSAARLKGCNAKVGNAYALALETAARSIQNGEHHKEQEG